MKATVTYYLREKGRKASILGGGDGLHEQCVEVGRDAPEFAQVVELGDIAHNGDVTLTVYHCVHEFDAPQTAAQVVEFVGCKRRQAEQKKADDAAKVTADTLAVLRERKTRECTDSRSVREDGVDGCATYKYRKADWPYSNDAAVIASPQAAAWIAELAAAEKVARAEAEIRARADLEANKLAKAEAERVAVEKERKRLVWLETHGIEDDDIVLTVADGALASVPRGCWETHKRGKNWLAVIQVDPSKPGGLDRAFAAKARGDSYYMLPTLEVGAAVEFGADYYSGGGSKNAKRWYGFYIRKFTAMNVAATEEKTWVVLRECKTGKAAVKAGAAYRAEHGPEEVEDLVEAGLARVNGEGRIVPNEPSSN